MCQGLRSALLEWVNLDSDIGGLQEKAHGARAYIRLLNDESMLTNDPN
jgi:hypothetical protein